MQNDKTIRVRHSAQRYEVTIRFTGGLLEGLTHTNTQSWPRRVGQVVAKPCAGGSPYVVLSCYEVRG